MDLQTASREEQLRALWGDRSLTQQQIADRLGCHTQTAARLARKLGLPTRYKLDLHEVKRLWLCRSLTRNEIAKRLGVLPSTITHYARDILGLKPRITRYHNSFNLKRHDAMLAGIRELWPDNSLSIKDIAKRLDVSESTVMKYGARMQLPKRPIMPPKNKLALDTKRLAELWAVKSNTIRNIATEFGVSTSTVQKVAVEVLGLPLRQVGSRNLPGYRVERLIEDGYSPKQIGKMFGCSGATVRRVLKMRGVQLVKKSTVNDPMTLSVVRLRRQGLTHRQIGDRLGLTRAQVMLRCHRILGKAARG